MNAVPRLLSLIIFLISSMMAFYHYFAGNHYLGFVVIAIMAVIQAQLCYGDEYYE
tara:strand:- start:327 stop:491 length:165 start_codon:yes stop_codon:yes gene_type:complete